MSMRERDNPGPDPRDESPGGSRMISLPECLSYSPVRVVFGPGRVDELGALARGEGAGRVLLVTDPGVVQAGHAQRAADSLRAARLTVTVFDGARENPTTEHVEAGLAVARQADPDFIVAVGGGSAMDCAKGVNLLVRNGGRIADYHGVNKARTPMLPMICVPTTAGTGSEGQSFALISDAQTGQKMACGDRREPAEGGLRPRVAILDPALARTQPRDVAVAAGIDAISHAVESSGSTARSAASRMFAQQAWERLAPSLETALRWPTDEAAGANMLVGAHLAGCAIEFSMLGAAHACANPLTACCGIPHGVAVGLLLPHVVRFNTAGGENPYSDLCADPGELAARLEGLLRGAGLPPTLRAFQVSTSILPELAKLAAQQWTATFNPRKVREADLLEIYRQACA